MCSLMAPTAFGLDSGFDPKRYHLLQYGSQFAECVFKLHMWLPSNSVVSIINSYGNLAKRLCSHVTKFCLTMIWASEVPI